MSGEGWRQTWLLVKPKVALAAYNQALGTWVEHILSFMGCSALYKEIAGNIREIFLGSCLLKYRRLENCIEWLHH